MGIREHGIYKYIHNNKVIYVGKTDAEDGFQKRIKRHEKEHELFNQSKIYIHLCKDQTETDSLETILINAYKPIFNKAKLYSYEITPPKLEWIPWELYSHRDKIVKLEDVISCVENGTNIIKIGEKYHYLNPEISIIVDKFSKAFPTANFFDKNGIRISGHMDFPTKNLLLEMRRQIDYSLENYDTLKEKFVLYQCEKAKEAFVKDGFILDANTRETTEEQVLKS